MELVAIAERALDARTSEGCGGFRTGGARSTRVEGQREAIRCRAGGAGEGIVRSTAEDICLRVSGGGGRGGELAAERVVVAGSLATTGEGEAGVKRVA